MSSTYSGMSVTVEDRTLLGDESHRSTVRVDRMQTEISEIGRDLP